MTEPITLDEAKSNLRVVDDDAEDALIAGLIVAAREHVESVTGLVLTPRLVTETARELGAWIDLASWPVTGVTAIRYPVSGVMTGLPEASWAASLFRRPVRLVPKNAFWGALTICGLRAATLPVEIDVQAGYATPADVPAAVKQAMHLLIAHFYTNRSAVEAGTRAAAVEIPMGVGMLLRSYRLERV